MMYEELIKALRCCAMANGGCETECPYYDHAMCTDEVKFDAAAAIEALQAEVKRLNMRCADCEFGNSEWPEDPEHTKMPKQGEWEPTQNGIDNCSVYKCSVCGSLWYGVGGYNYCPNCGAKMEVQE